MIHLQDFHMKLAGVRNQLTQKLFHPYLLDNITAPVIDEDKLLLLVSLLDEQALSMDEIEKYSVTAMLLQIALDTHENVDNSYSGEESGKLKKRQLTVLAGTYYSGLYYKMLAETQKVEMIKELAAGVKEVNEHKILVYRKDADAIDKLMNSVKLIEASLLSRVAEYFNAKEWKELASNLLFIKRMIAEEKNFVQTGSSVVFEGLKKLAFPKSNLELAMLSIEQQKYLLSICERYIDFSISMIEAALKKLPALESLLEERLGEILGQHRSMSKIILEEG
ncbi:heptaprenyl diphosphate synthase component 1 [Mesobacillus foraminis]|uniref:Heptaprenyl diphosphate synthase n=1 Tax=Mesobacillus foraminis TaxID=279826 RepID=A0A4R2BBZ2_9BACI|nr:heptaprenyl diphosphate synthase component 1 [Mesobacillus foraminis]TCN23039.1 heptaprenyl diphosphate synthase [Mesobacillus foraminis]